jgi:hypothetical protein
MLTNDNHEWLKILASAGAGLFAGLIAEPIKTLIQTWVMVRRIRRVLHLELVRLENQFSMGSAIKEPKDLERASKSLAEFRTDAFDYYYGTQRGLFYSNETLSRMRGVFESLKDFLLEPASGRRSFHDAREWGQGMVKDAITLRIFDEKLVNKYRKSEEDYGVMMVMAGIGQLTSDDIRPKPHSRKWAWLKRSRSRPKGNRPVA